MNIHGHYMMCVCAGWVYCTRSSILRNFMLIDDLASKLFKEMLHDWQAEVPQPTLLDWMTKMKVKTFCYYYCRLLLTTFMSSWFLKHHKKYFSATVAYRHIIFVNFPFISCLWPLFSMANESESFWHYNAVGDMFFEPNRFYATWCYKSQKFYFHFSSLKKIWFYVGRRKIWNIVESACGDYF